MTEGVWQALITSGAVLVSSILTGIVTSNNVIYRIGQLEKKVEKHNCLVERMVKVEESTKSAHLRINELKEDVNA
jgi:hypothetical protein